MQSWLKHFNTIKHYVQRFISDEYSHSFEIIEAFLKDVPDTLVDCYYYEKNFYNSKNFNHSLILQDFEQSLKYDIKTLKKGCLLEIDHVHENIEDDKIFFEVNNIGGEVIDLLNRDLKINVTFNFDSSMLSDFNQYQEDSLFHTYKNYNTLLKTGNRIGEYIDIPYKIGQLLNQDDLVQCQISIYIHDKEICRDMRTYTYTNHISYHYDDCNFNVRDCAWSNGNKGFGREEEIKNLQNSMKQSGITMIYGSSRIGKSSLLTYVKEEYSQIYYQENAIDSLIVISFCDATNLTYYQDLTYENDEEIIQFLFIDSIYKGLSESDRHHIYGQKLDIDALFAEVEKQKRTVTKIQEISDYLKNNHAVIWILIDEFQQLIDKWHIDDDKVDNWQEVHNYLKTIANIKFVLCGSDAIVKAIKNSHDNWHKIIIDFDNQPIMQLSNHGFMDMIQDTQVWHSQPCPFIPSAIDYLFNYVSGNATYGKLLANMIIDSKVLHHREHIFSYDVFKATSMMLENQSNDLDHMQSTQTIISQVTKNLDDEERYLLYMAKIIEINPNRNGVSKEEIYHDFASTFENHKEDIDIALEVCVVRGILKIVDDKYYSFTTPFYYYCYSHNAKNLDDEERYLLYMAKIIEINPNRNGVSKEEIYHDFASTFENHKEDIDIALEVCVVRGILKIVDDKYYSFTTPFYYYCYSHNAKNLDLDKLRETEVIVEVVDDHYDISVEEAFDVMMNQFDKISDNNQLTYLSSLNAKANINVKNKLLEDKGDTYNYNIDARDSTGMVINAQSISNNYNAILTGITGDELIKAYQAIPQFSHYVTDDTLQRIETLQDDSEEFEKLINEPLNQVYEANKQALILTEDNFNVWETLGITKQNYDDLAVTIDLQFMTDIYLGAKLEHIYENMNTDDIDKDYSPIAIMYCKVVEKMLKYYCIPIYIEAIPNCETSYRKQNNIYYQFGELKDTHIYNEAQKYLTIGSFIKPIKENINQLLTYPDYLDIDEEELKYTWNTQARSLDEIRLIRNKSAHGENGVIVDIDTLNTLKKILFKQKKLIKIAQLSQYYHE
ncbi:MAG: ATP-binding protein [Erysipelotrichaceae bacterium]|nr:ATP-binding protein [Erysipelotrichaceae bacterium]